MFEIFLANDSETMHQKTSEHKLVNFGATSSKQFEYEMCEAVHLTMLQKAMCKSFICYKVNNK